MEACFFSFRCRCKERGLIKKKEREELEKAKIDSFTKEELEEYDKRKRRRRSIRILPYPKKTYSKLFQINYSQLLTTKAKLVLMNFKNKYIYYAIDDILSLLDSNKIEANNLLNIIYSTMLFLYYNFSVIFFDIWIEEIYFAEIEKKNNFIINENQLSKKFTRITFRLFYKIRKPAKKLEPLW